MNFEPVDHYDETATVHEIVAWMVVVQVRDCSIPISSNVESCINSCLFSCVSNYNAQLLSKWKKKKKTTIYFFSSTTLNLFLLVIGNTFYDEIDSSTMKDLFLKQPNRQDVFSFNRSRHLAEKGQPSRGSVPSAKLWTRFKEISTLTSGVEKADVRNRFERLSPRCFNYRRSKV